jgi:hypothetical protein
MKTAKHRNLARVRRPERPTGNVHRTLCSIFGAPRPEARRALGQSLAVGERTEREESPFSPPASLSRSRV